MRSIFKTFFLTELLGGLWVALSRTGLERLERLATWLGVAVPLLA